MFPPVLAVTSRPSLGSGARLSVIWHQQGDNVLGELDDVEILEYDIEEALAQMAEGIARRAWIPGVYTRGMSRPVPDRAWPAFRILSAFFHTGAFHPHARPPARHAPPGL